MTNWSIYAVERPQEGLGDDPDAIAQMATDQGYKVFNSKNGGKWFCQGFQLPGHKIKMVK